MPTCSGQNPGSPGATPEFVQGWISKLVEESTLTAYVGYRVVRSAGLSLGLSGLGAARLVLERGPVPKSSHSSIALPLQGSRSVAAVNPPLERCTGAERAKTNAFPRPKLCAADVVDIPGPAVYPQRISTDLTGRHRPLCRAVQWRSVPARRGAGARSLRSRRGPAG